MAPLFTRKGDEGLTGLPGEANVSKSDPRLEALGAVDESTAALGLARVQCMVPETAEIVLHVQRDLYSLMAEIAASGKPSAQPLIGNELVAWLETQSERMVKVTSMPGGFIIPGDNLAGAALDLARTVVRRAERCVVRLVEQELLNNMNLVRYLNRLSSLIFILELVEINAAGKEKPTLAKSK